ncbi:RNA polymerase sigma factor [candidate division KSB1 bacterium]|nr:RNA polymerase sigma factor [candidate division KSB1 bacterium]
MLESAVFKNENTIDEYISELYHKYGKLIYNLAYQMTGNRETAEDITHETYIQVLKNIHNFRGESSPYTWMYAIAKNICLQQLNQAKKRSFQAIEGLIQTASAQPEPEHFSASEKQYYINQVKNGCLLGLLRCLSFNQRVAFILHILNGVTIRTVSEIMNKSENSVRILIMRAKRNLKAFLCSNCSLYDERNKCKCENLILFSLKNNWIQKYNPSVQPYMIETELKIFKDEIALYKTIPYYELSAKLKEKILSIRDTKSFYIFSEKKVK